MRNSLKKNFDRVMLERQRRGEARVREFVARTRLPLGGIVMVQRSGELYPRWSGATRGLLERAGAMMREAA